MKAKTSVRAPERILVIAGSGIGNILLATPVIRSLHAAFPAARIDVLVPKGRGDILVGNPDINEIIEVCRKEGIAAYGRFLRRLWRRYDLVLNARAQTRSIVNTWIAGRHRISAMTRKTRSLAPLIHEGTNSDGCTHALLHAMHLLDTLGIDKCYEVVPPRCAQDAEAALDALLPFPKRSQRYAVMHLFPRNAYKAWTPEGWQAAIRQVVQAGMAVVITGGNAREEQAFIRSVITDEIAPQVINMAGCLSLPQVSSLLAGAALYIGPDTGVTHLAAAHGIPVVALFGPTNPVCWGPWPSGHTTDENPHMRHGSQHVGNVHLVQSEQPCIGCGNEGCNNNPSEPSRCMQELSTASVLAAMTAAMTACLPSSR